ncbi:hypothetical protein NRS6110_04005 [Bacillus subtilis]|uniref:hypothetical protein n=1 Tax=Bacillus subtilis TaxID=1423 RepID=UPI001B91E899|nr:hypothetical protein [Bacillus subtilis]MCZ8477177.1 hypothetical protein [Bacillus subtilis]WIT27064.1 hypothetical protein [Bacillus phage SPbetaL2]CAF1783842.1 hypothetical protein NRS6110_04005 [Bacillus subtilis]
MNSETIIEKLLSLDTDQMIQYIEIDLGYRNKTVDSRKEILDSLRGIDSDSCMPTKMQVLHQQPVKYLKEDKT